MLKGENDRLRSGHGASMAGLPLGDNGSSAWAANTSFCPGAMSPLSHHGSYRAEWSGISIPVAEYGYRQTDVLTHALAYLQAKRWLCPTLSPIEARIFHTVRQTRSSVAWRCKRSKCSLETTSQSNLTSLRLKARLLGGCHILQEDFMCKRNPWIQASTIIDTTPLTLIAYQKMPLWEAQLVRSWLLSHEGSISKVLS